MTTRRLPAPTTLPSLGAAALAVSMLAAMLWAGDATSGPAVAPPATDTASAPAPPPASEPEWWETVTQPAGAATQKAPLSKQQATIDRYLTYYLALYDKHLKNDDWVARTMAIIGMAKIDDDRVTDKLLFRMDKDPHPVPQIAAWEALHARQDRLKGDARTAWENAGLRLAGQNSLRGDLRLGVLGLIDAQGPTPRNKEIFKNLFLATNSMDSRDIRTIERMGDLLKRWQSGDLIKGMIVAMGDQNQAFRAEIILHRVEDAAVPYSYKSPALPAGQRGHDWYTTLYQEGTKVMWTVTQKRWADWFEKQNFKEIDFRQGKLTYDGASTLMPRGEKINDTKDPKWRRDLELDKFRLGQLDLGMAIDTTASLDNVVLWVKRDTIKMMAAFELISREPRIGVVLYRDHGDKYLTELHPLTSNAEALAKELRNATAAGGGDIPEAVYEGLQTLLTKQQWSSKDSKKLVLLVGDAPPHKETMGDIEKLVKEYAAKGFCFYCIKVQTQYAAYMSHYYPEKAKENWDPKMESFDQIASWGNGESFWISFLEEGINAATGTAKAISENAPDRQIIIKMLMAAMREEYHDRVPMLVSILANYVEDVLPERRAIYPPQQRGGAGPPPKDPQQTR